MMRLKHFLPLVLASLCVVAPLAAAAPAAGDLQAASVSATEHATSETWVGALAGIGCGLSIKATVMTAGTVAATWAAVVSTCALMILDGLLDSK